MRNINSKFKLTKNAPRNREFLRMLREVEEEFGVKFIFISQIPFKKIDKNMLRYASNKKNYLTMSILYAR